MDTGDVAVTDKHDGDRPRAAGGLAAVEARLRAVREALQAGLAGEAPEATEPAPTPQAPPLPPEPEPAPPAPPASPTAPPPGGPPRIPAAGGAVAPARLGKFDYLVAQRFVTREQLAQAQADAREAQSSVETVLMDRYRVRKADIATSLTLHYRRPFVALDERFVVPPELLVDLNLSRLRAAAWLPIKREGDAVTVLVDDPHDLPKVDSIESAFPGFKVTLAVGIRDNILRAIEVAAGGGRQESVATILGNVKDDELGRDLEESSGLEVSENDSTIVRLANQIITDAYHARASDIHLEPYGPNREMVIRFRVDGSCVEYQKIPGSLRHPLVARVKIMAGLDIAERRKPQDGKIKMRVLDREIELRVATLPTVGANEDVVLRILASQGAIPIDKIGLTERNLRELLDIAAKPYGLILCVGPTGSGKTTTLHAVLGHINRLDRKIWTAEDPVEITQPGLRQVQVRPKIGYTFATAMRAFLRADPDVIMVGEMRDAETAAIGVEASLTGHLVLSTLHTNSAVETVVRLLDLGLDPFNFADALLGVLAQRLVKRVCTECRQAYHPTVEEFDVLARAYGEEDLAAAGYRHDSSLELARGKGCEACNGTGYRGRAAIQELLVATEPVKRMTQMRTRVPEMLAQAKKDGMTTLVQDGVLKVLHGITDFGQVKAVAIR